jgi:hypothetical protein
LHSESRLTAACGSDRLKTIPYRVNYVEGDLQEQHPEQRFGSVPVEPKDYRQPGSVKTAAESTNAINHVIRSLEACNPIERLISIAANLDHHPYEYPAQWADVSSDLLSKLPADTRKLLLTRIPPHRRGSNRGKGSWSKLRSALLQLTRQVSREERYRTLSLLEKRSSAEKLSAVAADALAIF